MGRILEYVVVLSSLSLIFGGQQSQGHNHERQKQSNFTHAVKVFNPKAQNEFFSRRSLPFEERRRLQPANSKQTLKLVGLHAFASNDLERKTHKWNYSESNVRTPRRNVPAYSQALYPRKNSKQFSDFHGEIPSQKLTRLYNPNQKRQEDFSKRYHKEGRNSRHHASKICDPCSSVPWVPLLKVPDSYRQQRTHVTELHPAQQNFNFDYHGFATNTHNVLLPPIPLVPPLEPVYDGTISSSFGLPIGNIPTSHGLLAPIPTKINNYDFGSSFNYFPPPQGLLDSNAFPELSPVPIVPIHDSGQFYRYDSSIPDLVPPPSKGLDVSKVVLTISEGDSPHLEPPKPEIYNHKPDLSSASSAVDSQTTDSHDKNNSKDFGRLEIVKSIPLAEFTSNVDFPQQDLPLYPPLQPKFPNEFAESEKNTQQHNFDFLVPPSKTESSSFISGSVSKTELEGESSVPKPLTSPSLSWLFSDHTAPPDSKSTASVSSFATETQEIASVVNNELRPVSPHPIPLSSPSNNSKSKKIQIIIPYTTKNKNGHDNNALESVQHEVFQPPVSKSTGENSSARDFATSPLPTEEEKLIDEHQTEDGKNRKYISEMHHIIASNIRELLREEIEKSKSDQNHALQNNIDNWTALEYSNHKTVETKAPTEILTQALAVTSIPGTSISHLLLPSKKIPNEYFKTTPVPAYDEPVTSKYTTANATVNSSPFTARPYATTNFYIPRNLTPVDNHEKKYTEVGSGRVNNWGRLNENLVLPEARTKRTESTSPSLNSRLYETSEKVQIVTPITLTTRNYTTAAYRRTTRHVHRTEVPTTESIIRKAFFNRFNSTKLEKITNRTSPFNRKFTFNSTSGQNANSSVKTERTNSSELVEQNAKANLTTAGEGVRFSANNEQFSINDIFPFRNKELPWETNQNNGGQVQVARQRKSLIKQVNLKPKTSATS